MRRRATAAGAVKVAYSASMALHLTLIHRLRHIRRRWLSQAPIPYKSISNYSGNFCEQHHRNVAEYMVFFPHSADKADLDST